MKILKEELLAGNLIGADETTHQVIREPGRDETNKSYMWLFQGGRQRRAVRLYEYRETRLGEFLTEYLAGFHGYLKCDASAGYNHLESVEGISLVGCWAHVRRNDKLALMESKSKKQAVHMPGFHRYKNCMQLNGRPTEKAAHLTNVKSRAKKKPNHCWTK